MAYPNMTWNQPNGASFRGNSNYVTRAPAVEGSRMQHPFHGGQYRPPTEPPFQPVYNHQPPFFQPRYDNPVRNHLGAHIRPPHQGMVPQGPPLSFTQPPPVSGFNATATNFFNHNQLQDPSQMNVVRHQNNMMDKNSVNYGIPPPPPFGNYQHPEQTASNYNLFMQKNPSINNQTTSSEKDIGPKESGMQILEKWLKKNGKFKCHTKPDENKLKQTKLWSYINQFRELALHLTSMSTQVQEMADSVLSADNDIWQKMTCDFEIMKKEYANLGAVLQDSSVQVLKHKLIQIRKKRQRLKRAQKIIYDNNQLKLQEWENRSKQIDAWQEKIRAKIREENLKKARKAAADRTLSKVTREIQDATRLIETMLALQKLRLIRRDAAQKRGDTELGESRQIFEQKIADMTRLVQSQLECYKEEEAKLKLVIRSEQEETFKKESLQRAEKEKQKQKEDDDYLETFLFGPERDIVPSDPLLPFTQYYKQAESSLQAFIQIRREWDAFLVPENTPASSAIPASWVIPEPPSSLSWASVLH
ncbi:programmed cell death protein 7-like [Physella acuta]|uniref:programmed cell death protein 7-like n=1 Tax=Physella acuta TaxID=109671 RepID=UPI0027DC40B0|nr:programmed cell death protein 7-like [Physella acuta]